MNCPDCNHPMHKAGKAWSGKKRVQRYKCQKCGRTTIKENWSDLQTFIEKEEGK